MTRAELARQAAIDRVGDAYVYGAWDQECTVANRKRYANLNSEYKDAIKNQCQRMKSNKSTCSGCKYEGRRIHDCRGLTSACAKAAGITTITGQTVAKQWNADTWERKGTIDTMPRELPYVQLFRYNGTKWTHTGIYIGNGETVDARGHTSGVIRSKLEAYPWTHWAIPKGMYEELPAEEETGGDLSVIYQAKVVTKSGDLNIRSGPGKSYSIIGGLPKGETVDVLEDRDGWSHIIDGKEGWVSSTYLEPVTIPIDESEPQPEKWGVYIPCDNEEEARRYAGDIKGAIVIRRET